MSRRGRLRRGVTPVGRGVIVLGLVTAGLSRAAGLVELSVLAVLCGLLVATGLVLVLLPTRVRADLELRPDRTSVGVPVHGLLRLANRWPLPVARPAVVVPSGTDRAFRRLPTLRPRGRRTVDLVVPAPRRGAWPVGPVYYRRTDPLGLFSRRVLWAPATELLVRPESVDLEGLPVGLIRDLEGVPSDQMSMSDLAFHALREYVPGDDLRHVHWRSSARAGQLLVRQYHDSRRTSTTLLVDTRAEAYADPEDFELALSVAASVTLRAARDGYALTLVCGDVTLGGDPSYLMDALCRATLDGPAAADLGQRVRHSLMAAYDASLFFLVGGTAQEVTEVQAALGEVPPDLFACAIRCGAEAATGLAEYAGRPIATLSALRQLPVAMAEVAR